VARWPLSPKTLPIWYAAIRARHNVGRWAERDDCGGVGRVALAALARHAIERDELRSDQPRGVARGLEQPRPMMSTRAGFHADDVRRQAGPAAAGTAKDATNTRADVRGAYNPSGILPRLVVHRLVVRPCS
jgi:hypothetical protein